MGEGTQITLEHVERMINYNHNFLRGRRRPSPAFVWRTRGRSKKPCPNFPSNNSRLSTTDIMWVADTMQGMMQLPSRGMLQGLTLPRHVILKKSPLTCVTLLSLPSLHSNAHQKALPRLPLEVAHATHWPRDEDVELLVGQIAPSSLQRHIASVCQNGNGWPLDESRKCHCHDEAQLSDAFDKGYQVA